MAETTKLWAMLHGKCPRCRRGDMFAGAMYSLRSNKTNERCPHCNLYFEIEPGYFYAAMYVSYAMNTGEMVTIAMLTYLITGNSDSPWLYLSVILAGCVILAPFNYRYSRILLLYWLSPKIHYHPHLDTDDQSKNT